jgi:hypothetical protein
MASRAVSLFVGRLPGEEQRQIVLFPEGTVIADIREGEVEFESVAGETRRLADHGATAAYALVAALNDHGWYIDEMPTPTAIWLKPKPPEFQAAVAINEVRVMPRTQEPDAGV